MRFSSRTWSLLSLMLFIAAAYFWLKGNELQERRRKARQNVVAETNSKTAGIDLLSPKTSRKPLAQLMAQANSASGQNQNVPADKAYPYRVRNTARDVNDLVREEKAILLANAMIDTATGQPIPTCT